MGKKLSLTAEQKRDVVVRLLRREEPASALACRFAIAEATLYRWRDAFLEGGTSALGNGKGQADAAARRVEQLQRELAERDRVIGELTIANRILKKTADGLY